MKNYLNFETDIKNLEGELDKLKDPYNQGGLSEVDTNKISKTQEELDKKLKDIYSNLDPWQGQKNPPIQLSPPRSAAPTSGR